MKNRIIDSIGNIDADMIENVAALRQQKQRKSTWHRWCAIAACFLLIAAIALPLFSGKDTVSPFVIKAYATAPDGSILEQEMAEGVSFPVTVITADDGTSGFLFSIGETDSKQPASVSILTAGEYGDASISHIMEFAGLELMQGRSYVFFVGDLSAFGNLTIVHRNEDGTVRAEVTISITEGADGYTARLEKLTSYPVQEKK